jgi:hypothetical protein
MIRKISNIIIAFVLLISTTGFTISKHYCGGELISIEVNAEAETCCDSPDCCQTETQFNKLSVDFIGSVSEVPLDQKISFKLVELVNNLDSFLDDELPNKDIKPFLKILSERDTSFQSLFQSFRL